MKTQFAINVIEEKYTPSVIEPSFGLGRIMSVMLEHTFRVRDEKRTYLVLKPRIAPVKVSILPLQNDPRFGDIIHELSNFIFKFRTEVEEGFIDL